MPQMSLTVHPALPSRHHQGAATQQEFYAKNSRWTEGLISASKAVGWGATQLVYVTPWRGSGQCDARGLGGSVGVAQLSVGLETQALPGSVPRESADKVVLHTGKYEELIVCSHEIAASTAQLVAASKVRLQDRPGPSPMAPQLLAVVDTLRVAGGPGDGAIPGPSLTLPHAPLGEGRQAQPQPEPPAGVLPHGQRDGRQRGGLHEVRPGAD